MEWKKAGIWTVIVVFAAPFVVYLVPQLLGLDAYVVKSDSMSPTLQRGSVLYVEGTSERQLQKGDIITFTPEADWTSENKIAHRIVDRKMENTTVMFKTKGDNNIEADPGWITAENVLGEQVYSIPLLGYIVTGAHTIWFVLFLVVLPSAILVKMEIEKILKKRERLFEIA